jgi:hypothetical protein
MIRAYVIALAALLLALPGAAHAGGFATVGLSSLPDGMAPGEPWQVELTILQHGRTPLEGVEPSVILRRSGRPGTRTFHARPTDRAGVYEAKVTFPSAGLWRYVVYDGFAARYSFPPVRVRRDGSRTVAAAADRPASAGTGGPDIGLALGLAVVVGLAGMAAVMELQRRRLGPAAGQE